MSVNISFDDVAVSTRVRLARNFEDYPFPNRLHSKESAMEIIRMIDEGLKTVEDFTLHYMDTLAQEKVELLKERNLISQALINHRDISAVLLSRDQKISIMINEEDHIREQYFLNGYDLRRAHERVSGIDEIISEIIPFAFDKTLGYLTACPTNLGTGLRASVMLFLPALARRDRMREIIPKLKKEGLTVRGAYGEGSSAEGHLYQISNEVTLGMSEAEILSSVEKAMYLVCSAELHERELMLEEGGISFIDGILRAYGTLSNCMTLDPNEFMRLMTEVKLGVACGILDGNMQQLDALLVDMRPANIDHLNGAALSREEKNIYRAEYIGTALRGMELLTEKKRSSLSPRR